MTGDQHSQDDRFTAHVLRPARIICMICQMILGAGLAVALILKVYMIVLTDYQCQADLATLGNAIRCTSSMTMCAYVLALAAGFELARLLFEDTMEKAMKPLLFALSSTFLFVLSGMSTKNADWQIAITLTALTTSLIGGMAFRYWIRSGKWQDRASRDDPNTPQRPN